ncbi:hypothetical protein OXX79_012130, partial [Metschnikowia pulcherrima]
TTTSSSSITVATGGAANLVGVGAFGAAAAAGIALLM